jgi:hypothetical protein
MCVFVHVWFLVACQFQCVPISMWCELLLFGVCFFNTPGNTWSCSWDTPFPLIHERFYIPDYLRVFEGIKATIEY